MVILFYKDLKDQDHWVPCNIIIIKQNKLNKAMKANIFINNMGETK